jgi:hypothetical protein
MISTFNELRSTLEKRLREAGLAQFVNRERSQFLDLEGEVFAEVVLNDGSVLDEVEKIVHLAADEMKTQGVSLDSIVRALWEIVSVEYTGRTSSTPDLTNWRAAEEFRVVLRSGTRECHVIVNVTWGAIELLERKVGLREKEPSAALPPGHVVREMVGPIVRRFIEQALSRGGASYWDPLQFSQIELTATDMSFLMGQSTAFEELRQAISDAFDPPVLDSFLGSLAVSGIKKILDFDAVLPELSNMLGGAYRKGDTFSTSASELYRRLDRTEQELLRKYYHGKIDQLKRDPHFASLAEKYHIDLGPIGTG